MPRTQGCVWRATQVEPQETASPSFSAHMALPTGPIDEGQPDASGGMSALMGLTLGGLSIQSQPPSTTVTPRPSSPRSLHPQAIGIAPGGPSDPVEIGSTGPRHESPDAAAALAGLALSERKGSWQRPPQVPLGPGLLIGEETSAPSEPPPCEGLQETPED